MYANYDAMMHRETPLPTVKESAEEKKQAAGGKAAYGKEQRRRRAEVRARVKALEDELEALAPPSIRFYHEETDEKTVAGSAAEVF